MKKYIFGAVLSLGILVSPAFTHAAGLTSSQINAIIGLLQSFGTDQSVIASVQATLNGTSTGDGTKAWCHTFNSNLTVGSAGADVSALNQALSSSGIDTSGDTSTFDENTAGDVVQFQAKYGIRQTGYVGPRTRAKLNSLYGCGTITPPKPKSSITVLSPNGGESWVIGSTQTIRWSAPSMFDKVSITFYTPSPPPCYSNCPLLGMPDIAPTTIAQNVPNVGYYTWTLTNPLKDTYGRLIQPGSYRIQVSAYSNNTGSSDSSDAPFSIVAPGTTVAPTISSIQPTFGPVGTTVTLGGSGFAATNSIYLNGMLIETQSNSNSAGLIPTAIKFVIPSQFPQSCTAAGGCTGGNMISSGAYTISIKNANGTSNEVSFTVTANQISSAFFISQSSGADSNDGSQSKPFKTINAALSALRARHSTKANYIVSFLDAVYQLSDAINIDATLLGDGSSFTLQGASGGTNLTFATTVSSDSLMKDDTLLPRPAGEAAYNFGGMYGYVNSKPAINPATGASTCPTGQIAATFLGQTNVDYPATFCYGTSAVSEPLYDFGGMYGYVEGKPTVNAVTGSVTCPAGYTGTDFFGTTNVDWPATFCYRPHVSGQSPDYKFGGMYGYVNGKPAPNPITGSASCPVGYSASQVVGALNVDWPAWYCYQKSTPSLAGHVYVMPTDQEPAGVIVDGAIATQASYDLPSNTRNSDDTFTLQMPEGVSSAASPLVAVGKNQWRLFRCPVTSLNASSNLGGTYSTTIDSACLNSTKTLGESNAFSHISSIEGSATFLSRHGQWAYITSPSPRIAIYLTQPASITIIPRGQSHFISIRGTEATPVQNIHIQNLQFSNGGFQDTHDYVTLQSGVNIQAGTNTNAIQNAAVEVENAKNISIAKSIFTHLVGAAVWIGSNSNAVEVSGNKFIDIAGTGVEAGYWHPADSEQHAILALKVNDNSFTNVGRIFLDSSVIFATYIKDSEIARNTISHAPYSGISLGWGWTYSPQIGLGNDTVHDNRISNVMESLNDGGGIYLNSRMNGTDVYGNTIGPIGETSTPWKGFPLYADDGNGGDTIHDNQIQNVDFSQLPDISLQSPIFGPNYKVTSSPCGYKACDVKQFGNTVK